MSKREMIEATYESGIRMVEVGSKVCNPGIEREMPFYIIIQNKKII